MDERPVEAMTDGMLQREIEALLNVEPSPEFRARVRLHVAAHAPAPRWWTTPRLLGVTAGAAAIALAVLVIVPWRSPDLTAPGVSAPAPTLAQRRPDAGRGELPTLSKPSGVAAARPTRPVGRTAGGASSRATAAADYELELPEVVFSQDEQRALRLLITGVEQGALPPMTQAQASVEGETAEPMPIEIDPFVIEPLRIARLEGDRP